MSAADTVEPRGKSFSTGKKFSVFFMASTVLLATWGASETRTEFFVPALWLSFLSFFCAALSQDESHFKYYKTPLFIIIAIFAVIALVQCFNPAYIAVQSENFSSLKSIDYVYFLPRSVKSGFADGNTEIATAKILYVLFIVSTSQIIFRHSRIATFILKFFAINATCMGLFAIFQKLCGEHLIYGVLYSRSSVYGTFFLSNAAGAFLCLGGATCFAATALKKENKLGKFFYIVSGIICMSSACYSESIGAILSVATVVLLSCIIALWKIIPRRAFGVGIALLSIAAIIGITTIEVHKIPVVEEQIAECTMSKSSRLKIYSETIEYIGENPIWGVGGNAYKYVFRPRMIQKYLSRSSAPEHAHSDPLQYIAEYGIVGGILILAAIGAWVISIYKARSKLTKANALLAIGVVVCALHSCIDMHLSIPSTMTVFAISAILVSSRLGKAGR